MSIVCTREEKKYWYDQEEFLCRRILIPVVNLFPHVEVVVSASIELKWYTTDPMKHKVGAKHICNVGKGP